MLLTDYVCERANPVENPNFLNHFRNAKTRAPCALPLNGTNEVAGDTVYRSCSLSKKGGIECHP